MGVLSFGYGYAAVLVGGLLSLTGHSPTTGVLVGVFGWALACFYGTLVLSRTARLAESAGSHGAADDFTRRWRSLAADRRDS